MPKGYISLGYTPLLALYIHIYIITCSICANIGKR